MIHKHPLTKTWIIHSKTEKRRKMVKKNQVKQKPVTHNGELPQPVYRTHFLEY